MKTFGDNMSRFRSPDADKRIIVVCVLAIYMFSLAAGESKEQCLRKARSCEGEIGSNKPVCGTDNRTYPTRCALMHANCHGLPISIKQNGPCEPKPCLTDLRDAQQLRRTGVTSVFIPRCRNDGRYAAMQCNAETGFCWCVTPAGVPVPNTAARTARPRCGRKSKSGTHRRSSTRGRKTKRGCKRADKKAFNANLIRIFTSEWTRVTPRTPMSRSESEIDRIVLDWKFTAMDQNHDDILERSEYTDLKKIVKKIVKPKRCAKTFARTCDMNRDQRITRQEWADCLSRDGIDDEGGGRGGGAFGGRSSLMGGRGALAEMDDDEDEEDEDDDGGLSILANPGVLQSSVSSAGGGYSDESSDGGAGGGDDTDTTDCLADRRAVLNEPTADKLYVPECTPDGRYRKVQCYSSYCWCVDEDTGKNIAGTSVKDKMPKCDSVPAAYTRPMKGCPEHRKIQFLKDLVDFLSQKMVAGTNGTNIMGGRDINSTWQASEEEKAATWSFVVLDKNKNHVLERKEWKTFRSMVSANKLLRHCGKKLPRYCDVNKDRKISLTEWLNCLGVNVPTQQKPKSSIRSKPNPIEIFLKSD